MKTLLRFTSQTQRYSPERTDLLDKIADAVRRKERRCECIAAEDRFSRNRQAVPYPRRIIRLMVSWRRPRMT